MENAIEFLNEYKKLCLKYNLEIKGCGDCGSAWLSKLDEENLKYKTIVYQKDFQCIQFAGTYEMENAENIIKLIDIK